MVTVGRAGNYLINTNSSISRIILKFLVYYDTYQLEENAEKIPLELLKVTRLYMVQGQYEFELPRLSLIVLSVLHLAHVPSEENYLKFT